MTTLASIVLLPLLAGLALVAVPRQYRFAMRLVTLATTLVVALLGVSLFLRFDPEVAGYQFTTVIPWLGVESLGIRCRLGIDGINLGLILMGALVAFAAACTAWEIADREKEFYVLLLFMTGGVLGAFASLDLFFFYFFHELALVPTFIMIGVWGRGPNRNYAAFQVTLYLSVGALIALAGLIALYFEVGAGSFDIEAMIDRVRQQPISESAQGIIFPILMFGFGILVSLWPFHTWAPLGYASAPTPTAMLHAGVLKKFGLYGLIRIALPLLPAAAQEWAGVLAVLALGNLLHGGLVALRQRDLNRLIGYSSVAHMGFAFLGIATLTLMGVTGALVVMIAHGFLAALSFGLNGYLHQQTRTLDLDQLGGLLRRLPFIGTALIMAMLAGCGLPGFANFVGEVMVFFASWNPYPTITILAAWAALVVGAVYMTRAIRHLLHGPLPERWNQIADAASLWRQLPFALLLAALLIFGCFPGTLINKIKPAVAAAMDTAVHETTPLQWVVAAPANPPQPRILPER